MSRPFIILACMLGFLFRANGSFAENTPPPKNPVKVQKGVKSQEEADPPVTLKEARQIFESFQSICDARQFDKLIDIFAQTIDQYYEDTDLQAVDLINDLKLFDQEDPSKYSSKVTKFVPVKGEDDTFRYEVESKCLEGLYKGTVSTDTGIVRFVFEKGKHRIYFIESLSEE